VKIQFLRPSPNGPVTREGSVHEYAGIRFVVVEAKSCPFLAVEFRTGYAIPGTRSNTEGGSVYLTHQIIDCHGSEILSILETLPTLNP
jgi:hypothetical protein